MRRIFMALFLVFLAGAVSAGPDRVSFLLGSVHPGGPGFDGRNPGVFLTWEDRGGVDVGFGAFRNSYGKASVAATLARPVARWDGGGISLFLGAALYPGDGRRFRLHLGDVVALGGVQLRHGGMFVQMMPGDGVAVDAVIAAGVTFAIGGSR